VKVGGDGEGSSVKESVIPSAIPSRPSFIGEKLSSYLVSYGRPTGVKVSYLFMPVPHLHLSPSITSLPDLFHLPFTNPNSRRLYDPPIPRLPLKHLPDMPGHKAGLGIIRRALRGTKGFSMVSAQPLGKAVGATRPVRSLNAEVWEYGEFASVKEFVIPPRYSASSFFHWQRSDSSSPSPTMSTFKLVRPHAPLIPRL
jgi:hypothetical protein